MNTLTRTKAPHSATAPSSAERDSEQASRGDRASPQDVRNAGRGRRRLLLGRRRRDLRHPRPERSGQDHHGRVTLAAAGVTALAVTLLASGCTTARTPAAGTGSATITAAGTGSATITAPATRAPVTGPATTIAATAPPPATRVETFDPWTAAGTLPPGIKVLSRYSGGRCTTRSSFDAGNQYAWRCFLASGAFYDPCFAPAAQSGVTQVACSDSPWSGAVIITLAKPLAHSSWGTPRPSAAAYPWAMALANGRECGLIEGTAPTRGGVTFSFGCTDGSASFPNTGTEPWTVDYTANTSGPVAPVAVTTVFA
jgi:hypothetical protein